MFDFTQLYFEKLVAHRVGNKSREEGCYSSSSLHPLDDDMLQTVLFDFFFHSFKSEDMFKFSHQADLRMNDMYTYCQNIFQEPDSFLELSDHILQHLYEASSHPRVKGGELYIGLFNDVLIDDELVQAIGIFKSENKNTFLKVNDKAGRLEIQYQDGIDARKLDKGVLIFNTLEADGYLVKTIDALTNASDDAKFWKDDFLGLQPIENSVYTTREYLHLCKNFVEEVMAPEQNLPKKEKLDIIRKSMDYFEENEDFRLDNFADVVLEEPSVKEKFMNYKKEQEYKTGKSMDDVFEISQNAVKQEKKKLKHMIELDNSIQIKLIPEHNERNNKVIERGYDEQKGMYFYKIYYKLES